MNNAQRKIRQLETAGSNLIQGGEKIAKNIYKDSLNQIDKFEDQVKGYSDELIKGIQRKPFVSVLIAGSIGFLLSFLWKR